MTSTSPPRPVLPRLLAFAAFGLVLVLWVYGLYTEPDRLGRPAELEYFLADWLLLLPLALAAGYGLSRARPWARPLFLVMAGAGGYGALHFVIHLIRAESPVAPRPLLGLALAVILGVLALGVRQVVAALAPPPAGG
jgi:hypothetical protein